MKHPQLIQEITQAALSKSHVQRSPQYTEGIKATLEYYIHNISTTLPYKEGSPEADAWLYGTIEGESIYRKWMNNDKSMWRH